MNSIHKLILSVHLQEIEWHWHWDWHNPVSLGAAACE